MHSGGGDTSRPSEARGVNSAGVQSQRWLQDVISEERLLQTLPAANTVFMATSWSEDLPVWGS